jgi:hypothetical protein
MLFGDAKVSCDGKLASRSKFHDCKQFLTINRCVAIKAGLETRDKAVFHV